MAWLSPTELVEMGFKSVGDNVIISDKASFYNCANIQLGSNLRIDDFCVISAGVGGIVIGDFVHISVYVSLIGAAKITISNFCGVSSRVSIYSSNDDYSGHYLTGPLVPKEFTNVNHAEVYLAEHSIIGSGSVILPGVTIEKEVAIGALSLVTKNCKAFWVYVGSPAKRIKERERAMLTFESKLCVTE